MEIFPSLAACHMFLGIVAPAHLETSDVTCSILSLPENYSQPCVAQLVDRSDIRDEWDNIFMSPSRLVLLNYDRIMAWLYVSPLFR